MKSFLKVSSAAAFAFAALTASAHAQSPVVEMKGLGSSALFLEAGLAASSSTGGGGLGATCVWSTSTSGTVVATDTSTGVSKTDSGNAWVAWTPGASGCAAPDSSTHIWSYLQTDSVVGNRCLFNGSQCTVAYPTGNPASASPNLILSSGEVNLPTAVANALNSASVNAAGTDIRPEDAKFAINRALTGCGTAVAIGSQYLGLGYANGDVINSAFSGSPFNVINFSLPSSFNVTSVGATPILVVVNGDGTTTGFGDPSITDISSATLAKFLDGTYSYTAQVNSPGTASGTGATVLLREPLSGTYNTMEYNAPNTTVNQTSQDVGLNQPVLQRNCPVNTTLNIATAGGVRKRAIGTGQELTQVNTIANSLGYGFWSVANFKGFAPTTTHAKYLTVDTVEPLLDSGSTHTGVIPTSGSSALSHVDLHTTADGSYPIWSMIRFVALGSSAPTGVDSLATATQNFVSSSRPDFIIPSSLSVVRSHFTPPTVTTTPSNGDCTTPEAGGDVGGQPLDIGADQAFCPTGQTGLRR